MKHTIRWTAQKIAQRLRLIQPLAYRRRQEMPPFRYLALPDAQVPPSLSDDAAGWLPIPPGSYWGRWRTMFLLRNEFLVPQWPDQGPLALHLPIGDADDYFMHPEALVYLDGQPVATVDRCHTEFLLPQWALDGRSHRLDLHGWTGLGDFGAGTRSQLFMGSCAVVQIDQPTRDFIAAARVALETANTLNEHHPAKGELLNALDAAFRRLDTREPFGEAFYVSVPEAHQVLQEGVAQAGPPLAVGIIATGHAHIDVAWWWTLDQTRHKVRRSFITALRLMEQFPNYVFTQSQPQLYDFIRQDDPGLFQAIRRRVAEGRWETIGGMWVEADCNLSGPESLARQFLLGRRFFREHFGPVAESPVLWLPDVFGYASNLPQLIKQAGLEYFFTTKIGWNQYNRLPYDSFWWQGLDGTRVLTHFATTPEVPGQLRGTYNADVTPSSVLETWTNFQQKDVQRDLMMAFGYGDGGGGPNREMLENLRELAAMPGLPQARPGRMIDFFRQMEAKAGPELPTWQGELYLELHRGTYTTQGRNKRANRRSEFLLHDAEFLAALASLVSDRSSVIGDRLTGNRPSATDLIAKYQYPHTQLRHAWQLVCLNQFHDVIPGSSIAEVYVESQAQYAEVAQIGQQALEEALAAIARHVPGYLLIANPTGFEHTDLAWWPGTLPAGHRLVRQDGAPVSCQAGPTGTWLAAGPLPPYSVSPLFLVQGDLPPLYAEGLRVTPQLLENDHLRVEFDRAGDVVAIFDKIANRQVLPDDARANQFQAFEDRPLMWDAWDIDIFYDDRVWLAEPAQSIEIVEAGPLRATLRICRRILNSEIVQEISLARHSRRLDFTTRIDWHERHILLKVAFPVEILAPTATFEVQWGNVERPTHRNTSWDWARFESCAQKWVDLSEGDYGVSLLNNGKYGHDVRDNVLRLSLLRSPTQPDPEADQGHHEFTYSLLPHAGCWGSKTVAAAYALNDPLLVWESGMREAPAIGSEGMVQSLVQVDRTNVVIETVKGAEDGRGLIVRLYESQRQRGPVTVTAGFPLAAAWRTNLLEEAQSELPVDGHCVSFPIKPYEIITLRLAPTAVRNTTSPYASVVLACIPRRQGGRIRTLLSGS